MMKRRCRGFRWGLLPVLISQQSPWRFLWLRFCRWFEMAQGSCRSSALSLLLLTGHSSVFACWWEIHAPSSFKASERRCLSFPAVFDALLPESFSALFVGWDRSWADKTSASNCQYITGVSTAGYSASVRILRELLIVFWSIAASGVGYFGCDGRTRDCRPCLAYLSVYAVTLGTIRGTSDCSSVAFSYDYCSCCRLRCQGKAMICWSLMAALGVLL